MDDLFGDDEGKEYNISDEFVRLEDDDETERSEPVPNDRARNKPSPQQSSTSRQERATIPTWLLNDYADVREKLSAEIKRDRQPGCYSWGSFWEGVTNPFFATHKRISIEPELFYKPSYFVWLPHLLVDHIPCPECISKSR